MQALLLPLSPLWEHIFAALAIKAGLSPQKYFVID